MKSITTKNAGFIWMIVFAVAGVFTSCTSDDDLTLGDLVEAEFTITDISTEEQKNTYLLKSTSEGGFNYKWDLGNGEMKEGSDTDTAYYAEKGTYVVTLTVLSAGGQSSADQALVVEFDASTGVSCSEDDPSNWRIDEQRVNELLNLSTQQISINGTTIELYAYLWRDFMPVSPPNGKNLISINWIVDMDSVSIPSNIILSEQYVIYGDSLWATSYTDEIRETQPFVLERVSRNGPLWGPNIEVTVIAKVIDTDTNTEYFLIRENQLIIRTD